MSSLPSSSPTAPPQNQSPAAGIKSSSNLYLITFLATLLVLLFVSCAVVLRSYVIRRRFPLHLDEAIAAGIILAPRAQGGRRHRLGTKPKMFTAWLVQGGERWNQMMPLAALPVQAKRRSKHTPPSKPAHEHNSEFSASLPHPTTSSTIRARLLRAMYQRWRVGAMHEASPVTIPAKPVTQRVDMLQVSVLIAMPCPDRALGTLKLVNEEEEIPHIVLGATRLPYKSPRPLS